VPTSIFRAAVCGALLALAGFPIKLSGAGPAPAAVGSELQALHELLEGTTGRRETWKAAPELVILTSVMDYSADGIDRGFAATDETISDADVLQLTADLTEDLNEWTGGQFAAFSQVRTRAIGAGDTVRVFKRGQIIVGRYRGVQTIAGTLGYGGRTTNDGDITAATVILDRDFDRAANHRRLVRTHELAHALGYNHVQSRPSVMNAHVGLDFTDFDRRAIKFAFADTQNSLNPRPAWLVSPPSHD
jgi:hypothetical protein